MLLKKSTKYFSFLMTESSPESEVTRSWCHSGKKHFPVNSGSLEMKDSGTGAPQNPDLVMCWSRTPFLSCPHPKQASYGKHNTEGMVLAQILTWHKTRTQPILISVPMKFVLGPNNTELQLLDDCTLNRAGFHISIWQVYFKLCAKGSSLHQINKNKRASQSMESAANKAVARKDVGSDLYFLLHLCSLPASSLTMRSKSTLQTSADGRSQSCLLTLEIPYH